MPSALGSCYFVLVLSHSYCPIWDDCNPRTQSVPCRLLGFKKSIGECAHISCPGLGSGWSSIPLTQREALRRDGHQIPEGFEVEPPATTTSRRSPAFTLPEATEATKATCAKDKKKNKEEDVRDFNDQGAFCVQVTAPSTAPLLIN